MSYLQSGKAGTLPSAWLMWGRCPLAVSGLLLLDLLHSDWPSAHPGSVIWQRNSLRFLEGFLEARLLGVGDVWGWTGLPISTTVGGRTWRWKAAGYGRAASTVMRVSGRWKRGCSGYKIPDPDLSASPASRVGPVIIDPEGRPGKGCE